MNTGQTNLRQLSPDGWDPFQDLPCAYGRKRVPRPARLSRTAICYVELEPNGETKASTEELCHFHRRLTEFYVITRGSGTMRLNRTDRRVHEGDVAVIPPGVCHTAIAGAAGLELLVITFPPYDPQDSFDVFDATDVPPEFSEAWLPHRAPPVFNHHATVVDIVVDDTYEVCIANLPAGSSIPRHRHSLSEEFYFVLGGTAEMEVGDVRDEISKGTVVVLPCNVPHGLTAKLQGVQYLIFATPPITDDVQKPKRCSGAS